MSHRGGPYMRPDGPKTLNAGQLVGVLRQFWDAGIERVSPGSFGMVFRGKPYIEQELAYSVALCPGIRFQDGWIVRTP